MAIRPEFRWWILTVVIVGILLLISALALDRPNTIWDQGVPQCPHCRSTVAMYSQRCPACSEQYDWGAAPDEQSPLSNWSLSALESDWLRRRVEALGEDVASTRAAAALEVSEDAAVRYLDHLGRGRCGWCGGTGSDLGATAEDVACPVCLGTGQCIGCGGDRRVRVGDEAAHRGYAAYRLGVEDLAEQGAVPEVERIAAVRTLTDEFVLRHAGTREAADVLFWPEWPTTTTAVSAARRRLDALLDAMRKE